jgi:hypothetical protein
MAIMSAAKATWLGVEVPAGQNLARVREDERVVRYPVRLDRQRRRRLPEQIEAGAHHLRLAAQAIRVLHALVSREVRGADPAPSHEGAERRGDLGLAAVASQGLDARIERRVGAPGGVGRERTADQGCLKGALGAEQAGERQRRRELRAVQESEPLLGPELERRKAERGESLLGGDLAALTPERAVPHQGRHHMRERRQVPGGAG